MLLDHIATHLINWMRNVSVQLVWSVIVARIAAIPQSHSAVVAEVAAHRILVATSRTTIRQFPTRHGYEWALCPFNNLQIANYKAAIEGD